MFVELEVKINGLVILMKQGNYKRKIMHCIEVIETQEYYQKFRITRMEVSTRQLPSPHATE